MSRRLEDLHPTLQTLANKLLLCVQEEGFKILIYFTLRTFEEQDDLYAQGRTKPGNKVTNAPGGYSYHNYGLAFDLAILDKNGKPCWSGDTDLDQDQISDYDEIGEMAEEIGLQWGKRITTIKGDLGHFQLDFGFKIKDLLNLYNKGGMEEVNKALESKMSHYCQLQKEV